MSAAAVESTHLFDVAAISARYGHPSEEITQWLRKGGYSIPSKRPAKFTAAAHQRLLDFLEQGAACQFEATTLLVEQELRQQKKALGRELYRLNTSYAAKKQLLKYYRQQAQAPDNQAALKNQLAGIIKQLSLLNAQLAAGTEWDQIQVDFLRLQRQKTALRGTLRQQQDVDLPAKVAGVEEELLAVSAERQRITDLHAALAQQVDRIVLRQQDTQAAVLQGQVADNKAVSAQQVADYPPSVPAAASPADLPIVAIPWADVQFDDGALLIRYGSGWLPRFRFAEARRSLNLIKQHYAFRQAPPLQVHLSQGSVLAVLNREVVLYYIHFLTNTGSLPDLSTNFPLNRQAEQRFTRYTKQYYRTHLPNFFRKQSLLFLCEIMDEETCIIPTPELVINSAGTRTVHDSFLFTYLSLFSAYIVWESTEEGKATYVFKVARSTYAHSRQLIYNYIVNDTPNKRSTLIKSLALQRHLGMAAWLPHTTYAEWKRQLRPTLGK